jgi:transcription elongation factor Elf1
MNPILLKQKETKGRYQAPIKVTRSNQKYNSRIYCAECGEYFLISNKDITSRLWIATCSYCLHKIEFENRKIGPKTMEVSYHNI